MTDHPGSCTTKIKRHAIQLGFDRVGIAPAEALQREAANLTEWLDRGYHGEMKYMQNHFEKRVDPRELVPEARSVISVALNYQTTFAHENDPEKARVSRYAWGDDYHDVLRPRLKKLLAFVEEVIPGTQGRVFVDSAPVLDKQWAVRAGIGWLGKHTNVITRELGSWVFLGEVIVNTELEYDTPIEDFCGSCNRCIEACPTNAIVEPYVLDARRCISYFTIELKPEHDIPDELARNMENNVFGCDICQDVCPWNTKFSVATTETAFQPRSHNLNPKLESLAEITEDAFRSLHKNSPIKRPGFLGFLRNVRAALRFRKTAGN